MGNNSNKTSRISAFIRKYRNGIDILGIAINIISIIVSISVTVIAVNADRELKESVKKIESLTNKMDSVITRMEPVLQKIDTTTKSTKSIVADLVQITVKQQPHPGQQDGASSGMPQTEKDLKAGYDSLNRGSYEAAIKLFNKVANQNSELKGEAYFNTAVAYARLSYGESADAESELYLKSMLDYLKKAARLENSEAQKLLLKYNENW
jgi:hypothetical protein